MNTSNVEETTANQAETEETQAQAAEEQPQADAATEEQAEEEGTSEGQEEQTDWQDRYLRLYAEFDNFRKRTMRERGDLIRNASKDVLESLLPILDDFERAQSAAADSEDVNGLKEASSSSTTSSSKSSKRKAWNSSRSSRAMPLTWTFTKPSRAFPRRNSPVKWWTWWKPVTN